MTMTTHYQPEPLLTPGQVATMFRVDPKTVTRWAKAGKLASILTPGGHRRFRTAVVESLLRGDTPAATPRHSVGVEPVTAELRQADPSIPADAHLAVVERSEGRFGTVCTTDLQNRSGLGLEDMARSYAHTYGATYIPAVTA